MWISLLPSCYVASVVMHMARGCHHVRNVDAPKSSSRPIAHGHCFSLQVAEETRSATQWSNRSASNRSHRLSESAIRKKINSCSKLCLANVRCQKEPERKKCTETARLMISALFFDCGRCGCNPYSIRKVPGTGLEPAQLSIPDPKSGASTNSAIRAFFVESY